MDNKRTAQEESQPDQHIQAVLKDRGIRGDFQKSPEWADKGCVLVEARRDNASLRRGEFLVISLG